MSDMLVKVEGVEYSIWKKNGILKKHKLDILQSINLEVYAGKTIGIIGESGCGKTTLAKVLQGAILPSEGKIYFQNKLLYKDISVQKYWQKVQTVFQNPEAALFSKMSIKELLYVPYRTHRKHLSKEAFHKELLNILDLIKLPRTYLEKRPRELSGGQQQRVQIARAALFRPEVMICDEPLSALDVSVRSQIINVLGDIQKEYHISYILISHDLDVIRYMSDFVVVMKSGKFIEQGVAMRVFRHPMQEYTKKLIEYSELSI